MNGLGVSVRETCCECKQRPSLWKHYCITQELHLALSKVNYTPAPADVDPADFLFSLNCSVIAHTLS